MENLKACYAKYIAQAESVQQDRPAWDGVLGIGSSMKTHPCHMEFYRSAEAWVDAFLKGTPTQQQAEAAVAYILETAEENRGQFTYWTMFAAQGLVRPLIPLVSTRFASKLRIWYDEHYPRREWTPVHKDLHKLLKKRERE